MNPDRILQNYPTVVMADNGTRLDQEAVGWLSKYQDGGIQKDLEDYIHSHHESTESSTGDTDTRTDRFMSLYRLSEETRLREHYNETISTGLDAHAAIRPLEHLDGLERRTSTWWRIATMISNAYYNRAQKFPSVDHYGEAIKFQVCMVSAVANDLDKDYILKSWSSSRLAVMYMGQHETSESADSFVLEQALFRTGVAMTNLEIEPPPASIRISVYENHCLVMFSNFRATSVSQRLEEAAKYSTIVIESFDLQAGAEHLASPECWAVRFWNHGIILAAKYRHYRQTDLAVARQALSEAIDFGKRALKLRHANNRNRAHVLNSVASWLCDQMESRENLCWGDEGMGLLEEAMQLGESDQKYVYLTKSRILNVQYLIFKRRGDMEMASQKLDLAISEGEKAVVVFNSDDRRMGQAYKNLADMQKTKFLDNHCIDTRMYFRAKENFSKAATAEKAGLSVRIPAAFESGLFHVRNGELDKAHVLFQYAISLLPTGEQHSIPSRDLQAILRQSSTLAEYAASIAMASGASPYEALRSLEMSRCIITGLLMKLKVDLVQLRELDSNLAGKYEDYRRLLLKALRNPDIPYTVNGPTIDMLSSWLAALETDIRKLDQFKNFQQPLTEEEMKALARGGPVVAVNISKERSDAIIVTESEIKGFNLANMKYDELKRRIRILNGLSNEARRDIRPRVVKTSAWTVADASEALLWLWNMAVAQILQLTPLTRTKRIWWITSGLASQVPFHAAGDHTPGSVNNTISRVTSSYISSFRALRYARQQAADVAAVSSTQPLRHKNMLLVTVSRNPPGHINLDTRAEETALRNIFCPANKDKTETRFAHLERPLPYAVLSQLPTYSFVHFACHGRSVKHDPSQSGLLLVGEDGKANILTLAELERVPMLEFGGVGEVAYLSACSTAETQQDGTLADEAMHLGNLFQALGFPHVIATLWGANDIAAGEVAKRFYENLLREEEEGDTGPKGSERRHDVANALRIAMLEYRDVSRGGNHALDWVPFVHIGA